MVDAVTAQVVRVDSRARVVRLSAPFADLLSRRRSRRRVVLVTSDRSRLTVGVRAALVDAGGTWAVHDDAGALRDGLTGLPYADVDAAGRPQEDPLAPVVPVDVPAAVGTAAQLSVDLTVLHRASHDTSLGGALEALGAAVSGSGPASWGSSEPLLHDWDRWVLTQHARHAAPETVRVVVEGPRLSGTVTARVTEHGIEETTAVTIDVPVSDPADGSAGPEEDARRALDAAISRLTEALSVIAGSSLPTFALVVAREGDVDRCVRAKTYPPPNPVALLIGAPSVKRLGLELSALPSTRPVVVVGRPRLPAYVVPLGDASTSGWDALHDTLDAVGPERLATMVATPLLQAWEEDLAEADLLHESAVDGAVGVAGAGRPREGEADDDDDQDDDEEAPPGAP
nr:DUF6177 family protein [Frigoribacterium endophyticum]